MSTETQTTSSPQKRPSSTQWHAFLTNPSKAEPTTLSANSQNELKKLLNAQETGTNVLAIVKGRAFGIQVKKSFEFVDETAKTEDTLQ